MNASLKVGCLVAGMVAGADSVEDMEVLRHDAVGELFGGIHAPSTLGTFLRALDWGNVRQLDKVNRLLLAAFAGQTPLLPGAETLAFASDRDTGGPSRRTGRRQREVRAVPAVLVNHARHRHHEGRGTCPRVTSSAVA